MNNSEEIKILSELLDLNTLAVHAMKEGNSVEALLRLFDAKDKLDSWFEENRSCAKLSSVEEGLEAGLWIQHQDMNQSNFHFHASNLGQFHGRFDTQKAAEKTAPSNAFKLFNKIFLLDYSMVSSDEMTLNEMLAARLHLAAIVLYNTGLISHRTAIACGKDCDLKISKILYERSYSCLYTSLQLGLYSSKLNLLVLGLFNNLGFLHCHIGNQKESTQLHDQLYFLFLSFCYELEREDYVFFYMTFLLYPRGWHHFAPAA